MLPNDQIEEQPRSDGDSSSFEISTGSAACTDKVRKEGIVEYGTTSGTEVLGPCLNVQKVRSGSEKDVHEQDMFLPGMQFGHALYAMNNHQVISEPPVLPPGMGPSDLDHRTRVGGGYNAAPNGALLGPSRRIIPPIDVQRQQSNNVGTSLQVNKIGANGMHMPSPGSFQQDTMSPQEQQWSQPSSQSAVPTPSPRETMLVAAEQSPQAGGLPDSVAGGTSPFLPSPRPYTLPPQQEFQHLQVPVHRMSHVNYVPQAGNAPLMNDYAGMPCNLQERMSFGQHNGHTFHMPLSLEETLANLPYDAIQLQRALSNHSGSV